ICINPVAPEIIYAAVRNYGIYRTLNEGKTWEMVGKASMDRRQRTYHSIDLNPHNPAEVWVALFGNAFVKGIDYEARKLMENKFSRSNFVQNPGFEQPDEAEHPLQWNIEQPPAPKGESPVFSLSSKHVKNGKNAARFQLTKAYFEEPCPWPGYREQIRLEEEGKLPLQFSKPDVWWPCGLTNTWIYQKINPYFTTLMRGHKVAIGMDVFIAGYPKEIRHGWKSEEVLRSAPQVYLSEARDYNIHYVVADAWIEDAVPVDKAPPSQIEGHWFHIKAIGHVSEDALSLRVTVSGVGLYSDPMDIYIDNVRLGLVEEEVTKTENPHYYLPVTVNSSTVKTTNTPCALDIDFQDLLADLNITGKFDRFSVVIEGKDPLSGEFIPVDYRVGEHYKYGTAGTVYWLIENPKMTEFRIWFDTVSDSPRKPRSYIPAIGVGDELLFNTPESVPLYVMTTNLLVDFNGGGITDALSINHYSDRFGWPYDGILFHPGIEENDEGIKVRDFFRIRYIPEDAEDDEFRFLHARYNFVCPTDWDQDGLVDLFYVSMERDEIHHFTMPENADLFQSSNYFTFLKNTGRRDISGQPILKETKHYSALAVTHNAYAPAVAVEDLDGDGKKDIIGVKSHNGTHETPIGLAGIATVFFYRNTGVDKNGLPEVTEPVELKTTEGEIIFGYHYAPEISFGDVNNDGRIDIVFNNTYVRPHQVLWH
ncbi:MAG: VCBS repeat-containing protein, partial [Bacteroidetes bacterium]|nr:VCBS repeat-containing protein [Bacteroidota bacterium]